MNKDELINQLETNRLENKNITEQLEKLKNEKKRLDDILVKGLTFKSKSIIKVIGYLLTVYEDKLYLPVSGVYYPIQGIAYDYMSLVPVDDFTVLENKARFFITKFKNHHNNQLVIVDEKRDFFDNIDDDNAHMLTFSHLLDEYYVQDVYKRVCIDNFDDYPYIKEFISMISSMQIEQNGEHLTEEELLYAMSNFINSNKDKPKIKELNKNN